MVPLNLVLITLVALSCSKMMVNGKLKGSPPMRYKLSNEIEASKVGESIQSQLSNGLKGLQPIHPNQLGWQPMKISSYNKTDPNKKTEPDKSKNKKDRVAKDRHIKEKLPIVRAVGDVPRALWVWNPLKQPKLKSNLTKVDDLKIKSLQRAKETSLIPKRSFLLNERNSDRTRANEKLQTTERKDNFFRGVLVLDANGKSKFLLQTNPRDLTSKNPQHSRNLNYVATSSKLNDLGVHGQNVYAGIGEDGVGYVGIRFAKPSPLIQPYSSLQHKSKLLEGGNFGPSETQKDNLIKTDDKLPSPNFNLVKGSTCR